MAAGLRRSDARHRAASPVVLWHPPAVLLGGVVSAVVLASILLVALTAVMDPYRPPTGSVWTRSPEVALPTTSGTSPSASRTADQDQDREPAPAPVAVTERSESPPATPDRSRPSGAATATAKPSCPGRSPDHPHRSGCG